MLQIWKNPASPPEYSAMSGISFSAPTAWRLSESRASIPVTTVDRLIRTPAPPVQVAVARCPARIKMTAALRCLDARNSRILDAPSGLAVSSISSAMTTTAGLSGVGWKTESPVCAALSARCPIRCRTQRSAPMIFSRTPGSSSCKSRGGQQRQRLPGPLVAAARPVQVDQHGVIHRGDGLPDHVQDVGLAAPGHGVDADRLAALAVPQDQFHRLAGLRDHPDGDRVADAAVLREPACERRARVQRRMGDRANDRRVLLPDLDDQLAGVVGGPDVDPAVGQAPQVRVLLRVRPAVSRDAGGQFAARRTGEQELLAEQRRGDRLQVEVAQADQVSDPVPFGFAGRPAAASSRRWRAARMASWRRSHQYPPAAPAR